MNTISCSLTCFRSVPHRLMLTILLIATFLLGIRSAHAQPQTIQLHVDSAATGTPIDGSDWNRAYRHLQDALDVANSGSLNTIYVIWVAAGTYKPTTELTSGVTRSKTFHLKRNNLNIYGGFLGTAHPNGTGETQVSERKPHVNLTILSGDLNGNDSPSDPFNATLTADNAYHVVYARAAGSFQPPPLNDSCQLDGFIITGGNANGTGIGDAAGGGMLIDPTVGTGGGAPLISRCVFRHNRSADGGGAVHHASHGGAQFISCEFSENRAGGNGGAINISHKSANVLTNCLLARNIATGSGGAIASHSTVGGFLDVINCTIVYNEAQTTGGGGIAGNIEFTVQNSILWGNTSPGSASIDQIYLIGSATATVEYSNIEGGYSGTGNINSDPLFYSTVTNYNYRLTCGSPSINAGNTSLTPTDQYDIDHDSNTAERTPNNDVTERVLGITVDHGAYESIGIATCPAMSRRPAATAW